MRTLLVQVLFPLWIPNSLAIPMTSGSQSDDGRRGHAAAEKLSFLRGNSASQNRQQMVAVKNLKETMAHRHLNQAADMQGKSASFAELPDYKNIESWIPTQQEPNNNLPPPFQREKEQHVAQEASDQTSVGMPRPWTAVQEEVSTPPPNTAPPDQELLHEQGQNIGKEPHSDIPEGFIRPWTVVEDMPSIVPVEETPSPEEAKGEADDDLIALDLPQALEEDDRIVVEIELEPDSEGDQNDEEDGSGGSIFDALSITFVHAAETVVFSETFCIITGVCFQVNSTTENSNTTITPSLPPTLPPSPAPTANPTITAATDYSNAPLTYQAFFWTMGNVLDAEPWINTLFAKKFCFLFGTCYTPPQDNAATLPEWSNAEWVERLCEVTQLCQPTTAPSAHPTHKPTLSPTLKPTGTPTLSTPHPTLEPSLRPSQAPSMSPTKATSTGYIGEPTRVPPLKPANVPSMRPTARMPDSQMATTNKQRIRETDAPSPPPQVSLFGHREPDIPIYCRFTSRC